MLRFRSLIIVGIIAVTVGAVTVLYNCIDKLQAAATEKKADLNGRGHITYRDDLYDIDFADTDYGWAVGCWGKIVHTQNGGKSWSRQDSKTDSYLYSVNFTDRLNGWAVGNYGIILHTQDGGETWERQQSGTEKHLFKVEFLNKSEGWAVGYWGTILYTQDGGENWLDKSIKKDIAFNGLSLVGGHCWVVGEFANIYHTDNKGDSWEKQLSGVEEDVALYGVDFVSLTEGWAVGLGGTVLHTKDGGKTWKQISDPNGFTETYFDVVASDKGVFVCGGSGTIVEIVGNGENSSFRKIIPDTAVYTNLSGICVSGQSIWVVGSHGTVFKFGT
ncbi:MAG: YCF48-related protein [Pseudomonadota bacterium]